ncbi:MAG TPA: hypothetical protein VJB96_05255 [Patescibacteria group bacterium]|nr:hypothetical protein [Patescibacteria group bacterium]
MSSVVIGVRNDKGETFVLGVEDPRATYRSIRELVAKTYNMTDEELSDHVALGWRTSQGTWWRMGNQEDNPQLDELKHEVEDKLSRK